jgi:hypothetical protein
MKGLGAWALDQWVHFGKSIKIILIVAAVGFLALLVASAV